MQRYQNTVLNAQTGTPVFGAKVYVLVQGTSTQATIYSDNGVTSVAQPLTTDALGNFGFYAANGRYTVNIYYNGVLSGTVADVLLEDPADAETVKITGGTIDGTTIGATTPSTGTFTTLTTPSADINGGAIDGTVIGATTPANGTFSTLTATTLNSANAALTGGAIDGVTLGGTTPVTATINSGAINGTVIGGTTPAAGSFTNLNGSYLAGRRNLIINGNFAINQRVVSGTVTLAAGVYGHDRWKAGSSGCTYTFAASGVDTTLTISAGSLLQIVAGENVFGSTFVLSWTGTAQARFNGGTYGSSPLAVAGVTAGSNLSIEFNTGTVGSVQLEPGTIATPFERRLFKTELEECQYYYEKSYEYGTAPGALTATGGFKTQISGLSSTTHTVTIMLEYAVPKRTTPTVTLYSYTSGASGKVRDVTGGADVTPTATAYSSKSGIVDVTGSTSSTAVNMVAQWVAEAEL